MPNKNTMHHKGLIIETTLPHSPQHIWEALTDNTQMKEWYFNLEHFEPSVGFEFEFEGKGNTGETYLHLCKVLEAIPTQKLKHTWVYQNIKGHSKICFELTETSEGTHVKLTHEGLEKFPQDHPDFARESFEKGWTQLIQHLLPEYLKKKHG